MNWSNTKHGEAQADELINWKKKWGRRTSGAQVSRVQAGTWHGKQTGRRPESSSRAALMPAATLLVVGSHPLLESRKQVRASCPVLCRLPKPCFFKKKV